MSPRQPTLPFSLILLVACNLLVGCSGEAHHAGTALAPETAGGDDVPSQPGPAPDPAAAESTSTGEVVARPEPTPAVLPDPEPPQAVALPRPEQPIEIDPPAYPVPPEAMQWPSHTDFPTPDPSPLPIPEPRPEPSVSGVLEIPSELGPDAVSTDLPQPSNPLRSLATQGAVKMARPSMALPKLASEEPVPSLSGAAPLAIRQPAAELLAPRIDSSAGAGERDRMEAAALPTPAEPSVAGALPKGPLPAEVSATPSPATLPATRELPETAEPAAPAMTPYSNPLPPSVAEETPAPAIATVDPATVATESSGVPGTAPQLSPAVTREEGDHAVVEVFYATDRSANEAAADQPVFLGWLMYTGLCAGLTLILFAGALRFSPSRTAKALAVTSAAATVVLGLLTGYAALYDTIPGWKVERPKLAYGSERGKGLELGTCEVSIPKNHQVGALETPSIFRLELHGTPDRHVVLLDVERLSSDHFFTKLSERIARSPEKDTFVFVHGYNVSFEDAARRTAQIAYDLEFPGAPIVYSWPSQSSVAGYTIDENNVEWTVPHLREFLVDLVAHSGAENVHLVAHSMGNRALSNALRGLSYRRDVPQPMFNHVVLTAPDVDADVFRRDLAPRIVKTAQRVTLYASSNDTALAYSKTVHGYPRAGDSGEDVVVVEGIDTIDVSAVDTSLFSLGHLYYGSSQTVLADLFDLIREAKPPEARQWLRRELLGSLAYWVFERIEAARAPAAVPH